MNAKELAAEEEPVMSQTWRAHLFTLACPEGYDPEPLIAEIGGGARPRFTIVDAEAITRASADPDVAAAVKAAGGDELPGELVAKALAAKLAADKAEGIEAKNAAIAAAAEAAAEAAAAEAAAKAAAEEAGEEYVPPSKDAPEEAEPEGEGEEQPFKDEPPPAEKSADVYWLLKGFPRNAEDGLAMGSEGLILDVMAVVEMDSLCLKACQGEPPAEVAEGEEPEAPQPLPTPALVEALTPGVGVEGSGLEHTASMQVGGLDIEGWTNVSAVFATLSSVLYASAAKRVMYDDFHLTLSETIVVPAAPAPPDMGHYHKLLGAAPAHALGVPYVLHCLLEQVVRSHEDESELAATDADAEVDSIAAFLSSSLATITLPPKSLSQLETDAAGKAAEASDLVSSCDRAGQRKHRPPPFGVPTAGDADVQLDAERRLIDLVPIAGKGRKGVDESEVLTAEERGAARTELHHFSQYPAPMVDAAMQLRELGHVCNVNDRHRGGVAPGWVLADRPWVEEHTPQTLAQTLLEARATSANPLNLSTYHKRDDVMLLALHRPVPESREEASHYKCKLYDLAHRPYGAWHEWLMKGRADSEVPPPPIPPSVFDVNVQRVVGAALYKFDASVADISAVSNNLYPSDHSTIRCTPAASGFYIDVLARNGAFATMRKGFADPTCAFAMCMEDGARAAVEAVATLSFTAISASGVSEIGLREAGGDVYVRFTVVDIKTADGLDLAVSTNGVHVESAEVAAEFESVRVKLPPATARPVGVKVEIWDVEMAEGSEPLASATIPSDQLAEAAGSIEGIALASTAEGGGEIALAFSYTLDAIPSLKPAPEPLETCRIVMPSGSVMCKFEDGSMRILLRDGNVLERLTSAAPPMANAWVETNSAGLRMGTTDEGESFYVAPVTVASSTDPMTHHVMTTRSDGTLVISRADGSRLTQFADGTLIECSAEVVKFGDRGEVRVNREGYPPLRINLKLSEAEISGLEGTILKAEMGVCTKLHHLDGTVLKLTAEGAVTHYPAALAWSTTPSDGRSGVYHFDLVTGTLTTKDPAGSTFSASTSNGHTIDLVLKDELAGDLEANEGGDGPADDDNPDWSHPPRLFVVREDGSGAELLRESDVRGFLRQREAEVEGGTAMLLREPLPSEPSAEVYTYVWKDWMQMHIASLAAERSESDAVTLLGFMPKVAIAPTEKTTLHFRRLLRREPLTESQRAMLEEEIASMNTYNAEEEVKARELHVTDIRTEEEKEAEAAMAQEMLKLFTMVPLVAVDGREFLAT